MSFIVFMALDLRFIGTLQRRIAFDEPQVRLCLESTLLSDFGEKLACV